MDCGPGVDVCGVLTLETGLGQGVSYFSLFLKCIISIFVSSCGAPHSAELQAPTSSCSWTLAWDRFDGFPHVHAHLNSLFHFRLYFPFHRRFIWQFRVHCSIWLASMLQQNLYLLWWWWRYVVAVIIMTVSFAMFISINLNVASKYAIIGFEEHEWGKHGKCAGVKNADDFFGSIACATRSHLHVPIVVRISLRSKLRCNCQHRSAP